MKVETGASVELARPDAGTGRLVCVGGAPGAGKTTVGRLLAGRTGAVLVDLDSVTTPLVEAVAVMLDVAPDLDSDQMVALRDARYVCLGEVMRDNVIAGRDVVAVAPFTREASNARGWRAWGSDRGARDVTVCWLDVDPETAHRRIERRALARDRAKQVPSRDVARSGAVVDTDGIDLVYDGTAGPQEIAEHLAARWGQ